MKKYNQSPLPFQGQKRRFLNQFKQALNGFKNDATYIDIFGGSGLLSHTVKWHYPNARVIWNDYDNYKKRLDSISQTNMLLEDLRPILANIQRKAKVCDAKRTEILEVIRDHEKRHGYLDYITISASLLFSAKYAIDYEQLRREGMYNRLRTTPYEADDYLTGVERLFGDYKAIYDKFKDVEGVVYLVDPPYLSTDTSTYSKDNYWKLRDYLDVLDVLDGSDYFYFTSNKSQIIELCEWIETRTFSGNPFAGSTMSTTSNKLNATASYTDIMLYKYKG